KRSAVYRFRRSCGYAFQARCPSGRRLKVVCQSDVQVGRRQEQIPVEPGSAYGEVRSRQGLECGSDLRVGGEVARPGQARAQNDGAVMECERRVEPWCGGWGRFWL